MSPELSASHAPAAPAADAPAPSLGGATPALDMASCHTPSAPTPMVGHAPQGESVMGQIPGGVAGETKVAKMACNEAHPQNDFGNKVPSKSIAPKVENQVAPAADAKTAAPETPKAPAAEPPKEPERGGVMGAFDNIKDFVAEHPVVASIAVAAAVYALQSSFGGGGSIMTAGLLGTATALMGGVMDSKADKEKEKKGEFNLGITDAIIPGKGLYKIGKTLMAKFSGPSADAAGSGATDGAQKLLDAVKTPAAGGPAKN